MEHLAEGVDPRTGQAISNQKADWTTHANNPMRKDA
jgi:dihydropyrimidine dehydrogenase (NAD+) subunit PreA